MLVTKPLPNILAFTRASKAWDVDASGVLTEFAVDALRRGYDPATLQSVGWALEGASTNINKNSSFAGAAVGNPGTLPTLASGVVTSGGLSRSVVGVGVEDGLNFIDLRIAGTGGAGAFNFFALLGFDAANTGPGVTHAQSIYARLISGSYAGVTIQQEMARFSLANAAGGYIGSSVGAFAPTSAPLRAQRFAFSFAPADGTLASISHGIQLSYGANVTADFVMRFAAPQFEQNYLASSFVPTTAGAISRSADALVCAGSAFAAIFGAGAQGWVIVDAMLPQNANSVLEQTIFQVDDGTDSNRFLLRNSQASGNIAGYRVIAGGGTGAAVAGAMTAGVPFRVGMAWAGGVVRFCLNGAALVGHTGGPLGGLTALRIGKEGSPTSLMNGRLRGVWGGANGGVSDAAFRAACTLGTDPDALLRS